MSQAPAFRRSPGGRPSKACLVRSCVLLLLCCVLVSELGGQLVARRSDVPPAGEFWSETQRQTYMDATAKLDQEQALPGRLRRDLWDVCAHVALNLRSAKYADNRVMIRDLLVAVDDHAVRAVVDHLLAADAPEDVRLHGIIALVAISNPVAPKEGILQALADPSAPVRLWAVRGAAGKDYKDAGESLTKLILDESREVSLAAVEAITSLKVAGAEPYLVSMVEREAVGSQPLADRLSKLEDERKALEGKLDRTQEEEMRLINLGQDIEEAAGKVAFTNLLIHKAGEALDVLTDGAAGQELKGYLAPEEFQAVIDDLRKTYGSAPAPG